MLYPPATRASILLVSTRRSVASRCVAALDLSERATRLSRHSTLWYAKTCARDAASLLRQVAVASSLALATARRLIALQVDKKEAEEEVARITHILT